MKKAKIYKPTDFYIRADANETIGIGHVMRCLSIAEEFKRLGGKVKFIIADDRSRPMIENKGFETICLNSKWDDLDCETEKLLGILQNNDAERLLIDSYFITAQYLKRLSEHIFTAYIDDMYCLAYPVNLLINYNFYADIERYHMLYQNVETVPRFVLGCKYAPLRKEFFGIQKEICPCATNILITSGGTDRYNIAGQMLERLLFDERYSAMGFYVVLGRFNQNIDLLQSKYGVYRNVHFLINISNIDQYMKLCDIAITAGGTTTYELFASGIPSIMYTLADNQLDIAKTVSALGIIPWAGDVREDMTLCIENILKWIDIYSSDYQMRKEISAKMQSYIDGKGAERVARSLLR